MSFMPYIELPPGSHLPLNSNSRRTAKLVGQSPDPTNTRDDISLSHYLAPPSSRMSYTGSLQDLSKINRGDSLLRRNQKGSGSRSGRASPSVHDMLSHDYDDEAQNLVRMNIQHMLKQRANEYVSRREFSVLCGTYNVNSQSPIGANLAAWLASHPGSDIPDVIAVGFQELDNSNQAYLFLESSKEEEWNESLAKALHFIYKGENFKRFHCVRLVGMMLTIFIKHRHASAATNVDKSTVGCGLLGRMGNKGGVAIRMNLHDTSLCFVCSHLSAHLEESDRRNQDFREINARIHFDNVDQFLGKSLRIDQHDIVFWMGDLNYRIVGLPNEKVKAAIDQGLFDSLYLNHDQLRLEMKNGRVFTGYQEGSLQFRPTYKYDVGTNRWDSSEKSRIPAWCDRVLWKINNVEDFPEKEMVKQLCYRAHPELLISDHKPVSAIFKMNVRIVDQVKCDAIYRQILRDFDKDENQQRPQAEPDRREIDFGEVKFLESVLMNLAIKNTGSVPLEFTFKPTPNHPQRASPQWLTVLPTRGHIAVGRSLNIQLTVRINADFVSEIALTPGRKFQDVLVFHLVCGGDTFIPVHGKLALTSFGLPLSVLNSIGTPLGLMDPEELSTMMGTPPSELVKSYPLPKEVFRLVDRLSSPQALKHKEVFRCQGTLHDKILIRDALDKTNPLDPLPGSLTSCGEILLDFLQSLPTPLIPVSLQKACRQASSSTELSVALLENSFREKSPKHHALFLYLLKYLGEFIRHRHENFIDIPFLADVFAELAFRHSTPTHHLTDEPGESHVSQESVNFILRLFAKEAGLSWQEVAVMKSVGGESSA